MSVEIGDLRHRITFQEPVKIPDGHAGHTVSWQDFVTVWASVEPLSGREYFYAHQIKNEVSHRVKVRHREDLSEEMRIKWNGRIMKIESIIDPKAGRRILEILCREEKTKNA